jgi:glycosyltransferase involved in cell wall biosynthesis
MLVTKRQRRGAEVSASNLALQLLKLGHKVFWVGLYEETKDQLSLEGAVNIDLKGSKSTFLNFSKLSHLKSIINEHKIDIIQANGSDTLKYAVFAKMNNVKVKLIYRNISIVSYWISKSILKKSFFKWLAHQSDFVVSVGYASMMDFIKTYNYSDRKIKVINRGIPIIKIDKESNKASIFKEHGIHPQKKLLIWAGSLSDEKNPLFMLEILKELNFKQSQYHLFFCGKGVLEEKLLNGINQYGLTNITLLGYRENLAKYLSAADLLVLTSRVEGLPGVVLEAAAQKTPSIAINVGGLSEAVINDKTGILLESLDKVLFAQNIHDLLLDDSKYKNMQIAAADYIKEKFDEHNNSKQFELLYFSLLNNKNIQDF